MLFVGLKYLINKKQNKLLKVAVLHENFMKGKYVFHVGNIFLQERADEAFTQFPEHYRYSIFSLFQQGRL